LEYPRFNGSNQALIIDEAGKVCDSIVQTKNIEVKMKPYQEDRQVMHLRIFIKQIV
jgi:hypothetical protein